MKLLIKGGRVIDPAGGLDKVSDLLIENGKIVALKKKISNKGAGAIEAKGKVVCPGLVDMHVHLREPGREDEETIETGTRSAAAGGFTSVACMANTTPVIDNQGTVEFIYSQARKTGAVNVYPIGSVTKGLRGEELSEIGELKHSGVVAISDDGEPVRNSEVMRRALEYAKMFDLPIISHCEDKDLSAEGVMNEGYSSTLLGLVGIPREAEEVMVARDISLAHLAGSHIHIAHISTAKSVQLVRQAKAGGIKVTCETAPHYFSLTDEAVRTFDTNTKMNPPLRTAGDVEAIKEGLKDGTIDVIATDHAPHTIVEKEVEYNLAPFGIIGLETALPLVLKAVEEGFLTLTDAIAKMSINPAKILGIGKGTLSVGADADVAIIDLSKERTVRPEEFQSKSRNSPFIGWKLKGVASTTIVGGKIVMKDGKFCP
ncbi:dihydroorotase [bacterium]|nr:dihydroorotase [bacterium]